MEMDPECVPCLLGRVLFEANLCDPKKARAAMADSLKILDEGFRPGVNSARLATLVHKRAYEVLGRADPYEGLKARSVEVASELLPEAEAFIERSEDRLEAAVKVAIAGNVMDFGIQGLEDPDELSRAFGSLIRQPLGVNDVPGMRALLGPSKRAVYLLDNCGEDVLDRLLVREIKALGATVVGVVKGEPVLTDVTMKDARASGVHGEFDEVIGTGMFAVGLDPQRMGDRLRGELSRADLIIAKGMANFESLSDSAYRPIAYLMRAKCHPVARAVGARKGDNVAKLVC